MVETRSRSSWGARAPRSRETVPISARQEVTLHYSAGPESQTPRQIQNFHMDGNGWSDVGYNKLVDEDGVAYEGRGWDVVGAHAAPRNREGIGICYIGRDGMTDAAKRTVVALYDEACDRAGRTLARKGHRDINSTSCPGTGNYDWWTSPTFRDIAGSTTEGDNPLIGLQEGDGADNGKKEEVIAVQRLGSFAGFGSHLGEAGCDGEWGPATSAMMLALRKSVGSSVSDASSITGTAYGHLIQAVARREAERAAGGGSGEGLPATATITGTVNLKAK